MTQHRRPRGSRAAAVAAFAIGALVLTGCSGGGDAGGDEQSFTFTFATSNNYESPYVTLAKEYMDANPGVTITTNPTPNDRYGETVRTQLQAGNAADVMQLTPGSGDNRGLIPFAEAGYLEPLGATATGLVPTGSESLFQLDGETYGQPLDFTVAAVVASMGTAAQNGITSFPASMTEFTSACSALEADGKSMLAVAGAAGPNAGMFAQAISATRVYSVTPDWNEQRAAGQVTFADTQGWRDTLQTVVDLYEGGCLQPGAEAGGFDAITNALSQQQAIGAFIPSGAAIEIAQSAPPQADFKVQPFPAADGGTPYILASSNYALSINAASTKKDAAAAFVEWMATPEAQQRYHELSGELPVSNYQDMDLSDTIFSNVVDLLEQGNYAPLPANVWPNPSIYEALQTGVQGLMTGQRTIDEVLASLDTAWDQS